jgi:DNA-binding NtrC family response regulator
MENILFIADNRDIQRAVAKAVESLYSIDYCPNDETIFSRLKQKEYQVIFLALEKADGEKGPESLRQIRFINPFTPIIVLSETEQTRLIVEIIKKGAFDFIAKPFQREKILLSVKRALESRRLRNEIDYLRREQDIIYDFDAIIASSPVMKTTIGMLKKFSQTDSTILLTGETGTGKSFLSGAIHFNSQRRKRPFIKINCANIPEALLESELFGHEKGAFTGATQTRIGRLEQGDGGTVLLDEICEMTHDLQAKLLRVLEEKSFERLGGNKTIHSDVRIICATNRRPEQEIREGKFREDLYYRINILTVHLPPLRERTECIEPLAHFLLQKSCRNLKKKVGGFSSQALDAFERYQWPGNVRQLANIIERAVILEESGVIQVQNTTLPEPIDTGAKPKANSLQLTHSIKGREKETILKALEQSLWVQKDAAQLLDVTPRTLNYKIKKLGISHPRWRKNK